MKMRDNYTSISDKRMLTVTEFAQYMSIGTKMARKYADQIGAVRKFGSNVRVDKNKVDQYLNQIKETEA